MSKTITVHQPSDHLLAILLGGMSLGDRELAEDGLPRFDAQQPLILADWPTAQLAESRLKFSPGTALWRYWTRGKGAAKWMGSPTPWTTLHSLLLKYVGPQAAGLTTNVMLATPAGRELFKKHHSGKKAA